MTAQKRIVPPGGNIFPVEVLGDAPPAFGIDPNRVLVITIPLDAARTEERYFTGACTFMWARDATSLGANINVRFQDQRGSRINWQQGMQIRGLRFDTLFLTNAAQAGQSITFLLLREGPGQIDAINPLSSASSVSIVLPTVIDTIADVSLVTVATTEILPALATRQRAWVSNLVMNAREIRVGDSNAGAARGRELQPGETLELAGTEAISGFNPHVAAMSVGVTWVAD